MRGYGDEGVDAVTAAGRALHRKVDEALRTRIAELEAYGSERVADLTRAAKCIAELEAICEINDEKIRTLEAGNGKLREIILGTPCPKCDCDDCKKAVAHYRDLEAEVERLAREILHCPNLGWHLDNGGGRESGPAGSPVETRETVQTRTAAKPAARKKERDG